MACSINEFESCQAEDKPLILPLEIKRSKKLVSGAGLRDEFSSKHSREGEVTLQARNALMQHCTVMVLVMGIDVTIPWTSFSQSAAIRSFWSILVGFNQVYLLFPTL